MFCSIFISGYTFGTATVPYLSASSPALTLKYVERAHSEVFDCFWSCQDLFGVIHEIGLEVEHGRFVGFLPT